MSELHDLVDDVVEAHREGDLWSALTDVGLTGVGVPESAGGSGGTLDDLCQVTSALAAQGVRTPLAEHTTATWALAGTDQATTLPTSIAVVPTLEASRGISLRAVPWASWASRVVVAPLDGGPAAALETSAAGVVLVVATDVAGAPLDDLEAPWDAVTTPPGLPSGRAVAARLALLRSAAIVGASRRAYQLTRAHVRTREQFGRPLIALPAVSAALARMRVAIIESETAVDAALAGADHPDAFPSAASARVVTAGAATEVARLAHQLHGALGITREYSLHTVTRALWALRDVDLPEDRWAAALGGLVLEEGEAWLWEELTASDA